MAVGSASRWGEGGEQPREALESRGLHPFQNRMETEDRQLQGWRAWAPRNTTHVTVGGSVASRSTFTAKLYFGEVQELLVA